MPIKKELYPSNWSEISAAVRQKAGNRCERCGVENHAIGARDRSGQWHDESSIHQMKSDVGDSLFGREFPKMIKIVLTVAHLDQNPGNNQPANLACLCQRCHFAHDRPWNIPKRQRTMRLKRLTRFEGAGQLRLEELWLP